jgi:hypothetical protein
MNKKGSLIKNKRKKLRIIMYLFILFVGLINLVPQHLDIDNELKPYINKVIKLSKKNLGTTIKRVGFFSKESKVLGRCYLVNKTISINKLHWKFLSEWSKIMLIAHELIHCECRKGHTSGRRWDDCPISIMHPTDGGDYCNKRYKKQYIKEMQNIGCN